MDDKLVSVCIPAYNNADYISETIDSILSQTYKNIELVIVDDNSKDNTLEILRDYEARDKRVKVYHNEKNLGMAGNWNHCLELCTGEFIKLMCADDLIVPEAIAKEVAVFEKYPEVVLVSSNTKLVDLDGKNKGFYKRYPMKKPIDGKIVNKRGFFNKNYYGAPQANLFRRSILDEIGGIDPKITYIVDYDFWVRIANTGKVYSILEPLNLFRVRNDSNTGQVMGGDKEKTAQYVNEHKYVFEKNKEILRLSDFEVKLCVLIRRFRCFAGSVYLKIFVR